MLQGDADRLAECPNFWIPREAVEGGDGTATSAAEAAVGRLHELIKDRLPQAWSGAEYWVQESASSEREPRCARCGAAGGQRAA